MKEVKVTLSEKIPIAPPMKIEVDGEQWNEVVELSWKTRYGEATLVTLTFEAKLVLDYVD